MGLRMRAYRPVVTRRVALARMEKARPSWNRATRMSPSELSDMTAPATRSEVHGWSEVTRA